MAAGAMGGKIEMRKYIILTVALLGAIAVIATQESGLSIREVRDPVQLRTLINANALDAETRVASLETGVAVTNAAAVFATATNDIAVLEAATSSGFAIYHTTQLVFIAAGVTNVVDADITTGL